jgi:hypothetical protein
MDDGFDIKKSNVVIRKCGCASRYQDTVYGKSKRVHNRMSSGHDDDARCTVCSTVHGREMQHQVSTATPRPKTSKMGAKKAGLKGKKG